MQSYRVAVQAVSRVADTHPEKQDSKPGPTIFFFFFFFLLSSFLWVYYTTNLLYCDSLRVYGGIILVGPVRSC